MAAHPAESGLSVSIVIVSRHRPDALRLCLTAVAQLDHPRFEIVVVACPEGLAALAALPLPGQIKQVAFDRANISEARNLGLEQAAGEVIAFIDDDAVPEPTWLTHLCAPFSDERVMAAGGYVRGRNGISFQWRRRMVAPGAQETDLPSGGTAPEILAPEPPRAIRLQGTNMAHRRSALERIGGFDPAYRFFLDETDLDMRHAAAGHHVAVVPLAQVHHGFGQSARRAADRTPRDLHEIGASLASFLIRHCPPPERDAAWRRFRSEQRLRLLRYMQRGPLAPDDLLRLMQGLDRGYRDGVARGAGPLPAIPPPQAGFLPFPGRPAAPRAVLSGRVWNRSSMRAEAARRAAAGEIVSTFRFSHSALYHRVIFHPDGYWEQTGGLWGRSDRARRGAITMLFGARLRAEVQRIAEIRGIEAPGNTEEPAPADTG